MGHTEWWWGGSLRGMTMRADDWVERAKVARRAGDRESALDGYTQAVKAWEDAGEALKAAHALRHAAELLVELGRAAEAEQSIGVVLAVYRERGVGGLELANALRVAGLAHEAAGDFAGARESWMAARGLYEGAGVTAGVVEADRRVAGLGA